MVELNPTLKNKLGGSEMNEVLLLVEILICFGGLLFVKKFLGVDGIYAWITIATCLAEIQVLKSVNVFGISATLGNVLFASTFLATDILSENYGVEYARKGPFFSLLGVVFYIFFCIYLKKLKNNFLQQQA